MKIKIKAHCIKKTPLKNKTNIEKLFLSNY